MSSLRIYFTDKWRDPTSPCEWALCDDSGKLLQTGHDPLANLPKGHECIAILAPDRVLSIASTLPPGLKRRWRTALPFIAEEYTLTEPDNNHVVPGKMLAADLKDGDVKTMNGEKVEIDAGEGKTEINGSKVYSTDVAASNGVMHSIGTVLIPKSLDGFAGLDR